MSSNPTLTSNRYYYAGKELKKTGNLNWLDFGARIYDPFVGRWTAPDPLMEKYPGISPYAYCAGNPMNLVDPDGRDWYSYISEDGSRHFKYSETSLSETEVKAGEYTYLGLTHQEGDTYYSLFGRVIKNDESYPVNMIELYKSVDNLIINYVKSTQLTNDNPFNQEPFSSRTDFSRVGNKNPIKFFL